MKNDKTGKASHGGELNIGKFTFQCFVLKDERRVITQRSFMVLLGMKGRGTTGRRFAEALDSPALVGTRFDAVRESVRAPIQFTTDRGLLAYGYEANIVVEFCKALLEARRLKGLTTTQKRYAEQAEILIVSLANTGMVALIDEATGYQEIRERNALQEILDRYLKKEYAAWAKRFPDEFYQQIFRLKKWKWKGMKVNRPSVVGKYTSDIVYERLAPGVASELEALNPVDDSGNRKVRHHQYLTDDIGHPALREHLAGVIALMRASDDWSHFKALLQRSYPVANEQLLFLLQADES